MIDFANFQFGACPATFWVVFGEQVEMAADTEFTFSSIIRAYLKYGLKHLHFYPCINKKILRLCPPAPSDYSYLDKLNGSFKPSP